MHHTLLSALITVVTMKVLRSEVARPGSWECENFSWSIAPFTCVMGRESLTMSCV